MMLDYSDSALYWFKVGEWSVIELSSKVPCCECDPVTVAPKFQKHVDPRCEVRLDLKLGI